jgi:hypothetical protein
LEQKNKYLTVGGTGSLREINFNLIYSSGSGDPSPGKMIQIVLLFWFPEA